MVDGAYNREVFMTFLESCFNKGLFQNNPIVIMDNVRFHQCAELRDYLASKNVLILYLPPYSPDLNPVENVIACIKARLNSIRPRATNRESLQNNIENVIGQLGNFNEYYRHFWEIVHSINNRQLE